MARRYDDRWQRFPESRPRPVEGGIATSKQRGAMADTWWSQHFVEVLDGYGLGARMQRGRRYARTGQVIELETESGMVSAQVQGSRARPYMVTVRCDELSAAQWDAVDDELRSRVGLVAALSAGEVPPELVEVFASVGVKLLPERWGDLRGRCTCPDGAVPCKHLAAVLYVFADQLDDDPWKLLEWRGRSQDDVIELLRSAAGAESDVGPEVAPWWPFGPGTVPESARAERSGWDVLGGASAAALDRLAPLDLEVLGRQVTDLLGPAYAALTRPGITDR